MTIRTNNHYTSTPKAGFREWTYSLTEQGKCSALLGEDGKTLRLKWVDLIGNASATFGQLISTGRIEEHLLIGVDVDGGKVDGFQKLYPTATAYHGAWDSFCGSYKEADIGVLVMDAFWAVYGSLLQKNLVSTLNLARRCAEVNGECLVILNSDASRAIQNGVCKAGPADDYLYHAKILFKEQVESVLHTHRGTKGIDLDIGGMYGYRQTEQSDYMLGCSVMIRP